MASASNVMYTNAVYWPNHRVYNGDTPGALNYGCINRVYYAFANVTADGGVFVSPAWVLDFDFATVTDLSAAERRVGGCHGAL